MPKATKKARGLLRRFLWQRLPWFWRLSLLVAAMAMAVHAVESIFR